MHYGSFSQACLDIAPKTVYDIFGATVYGSIVCLDRSCFDSELCCCQYSAQSLGRGAKAFCGYAATVEAGASEAVFLEDYYIKTLVGGLGGYFVAAGTASNYY